MPPQRHPAWFVAAVLPILLPAAAVVMAGLLAGPARAAEADPPPAGWHRRSMQVDSLERWYRVLVPEPDMSGRPVVLLLHGGGRGMDKILSPTSGAARVWPELAKRERFLLIVPNGVNPKTGDTKGNRQHWNDLRGPRSAVYSGADDVTFLLRLVRWAHEQFGTDPARVYVTGASNGGLMTYTLLAEHAEAFAAGAAFVANLPADAARVSPPTRPVPLMIVNGTKDPLMKFKGGSIPLGRGAVLSTEATARWWVEANRADRKHVKTWDLPDGDPSDGCRIRVREFPALRPGSAPVRLYTMVGAGHAMPSRKYASPGGWFVRWLIGPQCRDAEAAEIAWEFFRQFRR